MTKSCQNGSVTAVKPPDVDLVLLTGGEVGALLTGSGEVDVC